MFIKKVKVGDFRNAMDSVASCVTSLQSCVGEREVRTESNILINSLTRFHAMYAPHASTDDLDRALAIIERAARTLRLRTGITV